jgi:unsaturated chondroitin disaccharide hydrolase
VPAKQKIACGESSMWGDYHAREAALYLQRIINKKNTTPFLKLHETYKNTISFDIKGD